jgi:hypothetical protein
MANMSILVQNRKSNARFAASSVKTHREELVQGLMKRNAELPVTQQIDEETIRLFVDWLGANIDHKTEAMVAAELAYVTEQADDPETRTRRDAAVGPVVTGVSRARVRIESVLGDDGLASYGLKKPVPRLPQEVADYAGVAIKLMRDKPRLVDDGVGGVVDTTVLADALGEVLAPLNQALIDVQTEQRELEGAMIRRDGQVSDWHEVYQGGATALTGLYRMAGQLALSQRVRPTVRRASGIEPAPVEGEPVELPGPEAPAEDEPTEV